MRRRLRLIAGLLMVGLTPAAVGQQKQVPAAVAASPPAAPGSQPALQMPSAEQLLYLIRSTLLTLHDANRSGNYTVLRDLAAPGLQARASAADLAAVFADLRQRAVDLGPVALISPQLAAAPIIDQQGMLRLTGVFPTQPSQINFDLHFQPINNQWRAFALAVATAPAPQPEATAKQPPPGKQGEIAKKK